MGQHFLSGDIGKKKRRIKEEKNRSYFLTCYFSFDTHFSATDYKTCKWPSVCMCVCVCGLLLSFRLNIVIFCGWNVFLIMVCLSNRFLQFHSSA